MWLSFPVIFSQLSALGEPLLPALRGGGRAEGKRDKGRWGEVVCEDREGHGQGGKRRLPPSLAIASGNGAGS